MPIHPALARELRQPKRLQRFFDALPESSRQQIDRDVREVRKEETRLRRAQHAAEYLMEAMEAELDPPPLMKSAFARNAKPAAAGEVMPQSLRREYLIAIFRSRFPDTRTREGEWKDPGNTSGIEVDSRHSHEDSNVSLGAFNDKKAHPFECALS